MKRDDFTGYFDNIKLNLKPNTNEIEINCICDTCKKTFDIRTVGKRFAVPISRGGIIEYHKAKYWCTECYDTRNASNH